MALRREGKERDTQTGGAMAVDKYGESVQKEAVLQCISKLKIVIKESGQLLLLTHANIFYNCAVYKGLPG